MSPMAGVKLAAFGMGLGLGLGLTGLVGPTFLEKCRSDIQLSRNANRIALSLESLEAMQFERRASEYRVVRCK